LSYISYHKLLLQVLLLKVELLRHLLSNRRHLLQEGLLLIVSTVRCKSTDDYVHWSLGEIRLHVCQDLVGDQFRQVLDKYHQTPGGFLQAIHQWSNLRPAWVWHQQPYNRQRSFLKLLQLASQLLAILIELLQRFIAIDKVTV
jgi:hypothetical protein